MTWDDYTTAVVRLHLPSGPLLVAPAPSHTAHGPFPAEAHDGPVCILTAHNPRGITATDSLNDRLHGELLDRLAREGVQHFPAAGGDPEWTHVEESVAIVGVDVERARALGRDLAQDAIFVWTRAAWSVVSCDTDRVTRLGWSVLPPTGELVKVDTAYRALGLPSRRWVSHGERR